MFLYAKSPRVRIGERIYQIDANDALIMPLIADNTMLLPAGFVGEALKLKYQETENDVTFRKKDTILCFEADNDKCMLNGVEHSAASASRVHRDKLYIPIEDVCRAFEVSYELDPTGIALVNEPNHKLDWNTKDNFNWLNRQLRDVIYEKPEPEEVICRLREKNAGNRHPRLMLTREKSLQLRKRTTEQEPYKSWMAKVLETAEACLKEPPLTYELRDNGIRLLYTSGQALILTETLGFAYQVTGDARYADGAIAVMMRVCDDAWFPDWHPYHFLDVAVMAAAVALGYDWCYDRMTPGQRQMVKNALIEKALKPVMEDYNEVPGRNRTWYWSSKSEPSYPNNWSAVCFGGTAMAALAIGDEDLGDFRDAGKVITEGMERVKDWQQTYMPDGACVDGTGYWEFAMNYMVFGFHSMETALGTDYSMSCSPGFHGTFTWLAQTMGPDGAFNFASNGTAFTDAPEFFWYSAKTGNNAAANHRLHQQIEQWKLPVSYKDVLWYESAGTDTDVLALDYATRGGLQTSIMRSGYGKEDAWVAMYGGCMDKSADSEQTDCGSFIFDMLGVRWALDLGAEWQTYVNLNATSKDYYRHRAEGHNSVIIQGDEDFDHDPHAQVTQKRFEGNEQGALLTYDLTNLLAGKGVAQWLRGICLQRQSRKITVQDQVELEKPGNYYWFMHTEAEIALEEDGKSAILSRGGKCLKACLISPDRDLRFSVMDAVPLETSPHPVQTVNEGVRKLTVQKADAVSVKMAVEFVPLDENKKNIQKFTPLEQWTI